MSGADYYHAAVIMQRGDTLEDLAHARKLALTAASRGYRPARYLAAAALDLWLMRQGKPQKYGTCIILDGQRYRLWETDPKTSDFLRQEWDVPTLREQKAKVERLNAGETKSPLDFEPDSPQPDQPGGE